MPRAEATNLIETGSFTIRRFGGAFSFSQEHRQKIHEALAKVTKRQKAEELIVNLEAQAQLLENWHEIKVPSLGTRRKGLDKIVQLAEQLAEAIDPVRGVIKTDWWHFRDRFSNYETQLPAMTERLRSLADAARACSSDLATHSPQFAIKPLHRLAIISAHAYFDTLGLNPTIGAGETWHQSPYFVVTWIYANALSPNPSVKWESLQRPVSCAVKELRKQKAQTN